MHYEANLSLFVGCCEMAEMIDGAERGIPTIVKKTRQLLTLRGYTVNELYEYDTRYVMIPEKRTDDHVTRSVVWVLKEPRVVGVAIIKDLIRSMEENEAEEGILVGGARFTPAAKKQARESNVELVEGTYSSFDLFKHELVPKHYIASEEEVRRVLEYYGISKTDLPRIYRDDPAVRVLGAKAGQVIRVERFSPTAGKTHYWRLVVEGAS